LQLCRRGGRDAQSLVEYAEGLSLDWGGLLQKAQHEVEVWPVLTGRCVRSHQVVHYTRVSEGGVNEMSERTVLSYVDNRDRLCRTLSCNLDDHKLWMVHHGLPYVAFITDRLVDALSIAIM